MWFIRLALACVLVLQTLNSAIAFKYLDENFTEDWETRWVKSAAKKDGADSDIAQYNGVWGIQVVNGDDALVMKVPNRHYGLTSELATPFTFTDKPLIVQYEIKFQDTATCGGAYVKGQDEFDGTKFVANTPYTILFGPDKCSGNAKLLFIFRHRSPVSGEYREIVAKPIDAATKIFDRKTHLLTLVINPDSTFRVEVDKAIELEGRLDDETLFSPPLNPPKQIDDPTDKKPKDWVDEKTIPDPTDSKPADWDETLPEFIPDPSATKPADWDESAPEYIPDPQATQPDDWDTEEDGDWEAPEVENPKCQTGCGVWTAPQIKNPSFKGKWKARRIENPLYKGEWAPRKIDNPDHFIAKNPFSLDPIVALGFELWTTFAGATFDNIIITDNAEDARHLADNYWSAKKAADDELFGNAAVSKFESVVAFVEALIEEANGKPYLYLVYLAVIAFPMVMIVWFCGDSKKQGDGELDDEVEEVDANTVEAADADAANVDAAEDEVVAPAPKEETASTGDDSSDEAPAAEAVEAVAAPAEVPDTPARNLRQRKPRAAAD